MTNKHLGDEWINKGVSWGTMRNADLIPAFFSVLGNVQREDDELTTEVEDLIDRAAGDEDVWDTEEAGWIMERLFDSLNEIAPRGCSFGSSEGDGSDYRFNLCCAWCNDGVCEDDGKFDSLDEFYCEACIRKGYGEWD